MAPSTNDRLIGDYREADLLKRARQVVDEKLKGSTVIDPEAEHRFPKYDRNELKAGRVLGRGGFCVVKEIKKISLQDGSGSSSSAASRKIAHRDQEEEDDFVSNIVQDRGFMQANCIRRGNQARYAIKQLSNQTLKDPHVFINGLVDLVIEARFLSVIRHPNIIKMRGLGMGDPYQRTFFVVLDRLYDTLTQRVVVWKTRKISGLKKLLDLKNKKKIALWVERLTVAYDLALALKYLHSINVVYRDLKPDNIGFDVRGDVKIFDFGLAKELHPGSKVGDDLYKLTGDTGSLRYMAPEVFLNQPYNEKVDVFSFGVLLYYMCSLHLPYEGFSMTQFERKVINGGHRAKIDPKWTRSISKIIEDAWGADIGRRPDMAEIAQVLQSEIHRCSDEEVFEILDVSRKSELSQHEQWAIQD